ncbi:hypothetical protein C6503_18515 [Candidatus Poribacteria bacterium]|nr:MAG: hypothetical protein C6503_18515 [Candidatus Poribacteria bacterium]
MIVQYFWVTVGISIAESFSFRFFSPILRRTRRNPQKYAETPKQRHQAKNPSKKPISDLHYNRTGVG